MKLITFLSGIVVFMLALQLKTTAQKLNVADLQVEHQVNPLSVVPEIPRMSWKLVSTEKSTMQTSYEVRVSTDVKGIVDNKNILWHSSQNTDQSNLVNYEGPALKPGQRYYWQVKVKDNHGNSSAWSSLQYWQMGLNVADWKAKWITVTGKDTALASPMFRRTYNLNKTVKSATAYITAHGLYEAYINGKRVGDAYFTPGWTSYKDHLQYQAYDVTPLINKGSNCLGAMLADGWYKGRVAFLDRVNSVR
jgi:alpha-L-rhamnosidase